MKRILKYASLMALGLLFYGFGHAKTISITDMAGRSVTTPVDPARIVCMGPGALRLIVYLEAKEKVAGVEEMERLNPSGRPYWMASPELHHLPRCGPGGPAAINKKPDLEALMSVNPEVIFVTYMDGSLADEVQRTIGIPVVVLSYGTLATFDKTVYEAIRIAGRILGKTRRAEALVAWFDSLQEDLSNRLKGVSEDQKPGVYVGGIGHRGAHGIESTEERYIPFDWVHTRNLADGLPPTIGSHVFLDKETLLALDPDVIFIDGGGLAIVKEDFRKKPEFYNALKAFQTNRVYTLHPFNSYTTNIDAALADAYAVGKVLHPERFSDVDIEKQAALIYEFLLGRNVYEEMAAAFGSLGDPFEDAM